MSFKDYQFKPFINEALSELNFVQPTKVQKKVIPLVMGHENLVVESATGSGKSHAFLLPIFQNLVLEKKEVQALIITPTRELSMQLNHFAQAIGARAGFDIRLAIGGTSRDQEVKRLSEAQPHIVIGTVGRLKDLVVQLNVLKVHTASYVVIDEADMVFDERGLVDVDNIVSVIQKPLFLTFSATIPKAMRTFINRYLSGAKEIIIEEKVLTKKSIEHIFIPTKAKQKETVLLNLLKLIQPYLALIFVNKVEDVEPLAKIMAQNGYNVGILHGDLDDRTRRQVIKRIRDLDYQYIVASDIASRGIDLEGVSHVINFDLPRDIEYYIHRVGRTARHEMVGEAYSLYDYDDEDYVNRLKKKGLQTVFMKIIDGALVKSTLRTRKKRGTLKQMEFTAHLSVPMPRKVKPGYKKKRLEKINKKIRTDKKAYLSKIYKKKKDDFTE